MLGTSGVVGSSGDGGGGGEVVVGAGGGSSSIMAGIGDDEKERGGGGGGAGELFESGDRSGGGNRWPRQETIALLKIRSDMDVVFRDSSLKGPLWEEVSRKMAELGYNRSAKKCKEKFENVYKYHKRTKDGRVGKSDGKTYRFFDQLEALEAHHHHPQLPPPQPAAQAAVPVTMVMPAGASSVTVPSSPHPISVVHAPPIIIPQQVQQQQVQQHHHIEQAMTLPVQSNPVQVEQQSMPSSPSGTASPSSSSSSSTSSDEELLGRRKRKRKWKDFFERLMREVIEKQEQLQNRFLEAVEKREQDRLNREEAWKMQEITRLNREHEILVQERSMAAAKDAALISFLQKLSEQQQIPLHLPVQTQQPQTQPPVQVQENRVSLRPTPLAPPQPVAQQAMVVAANVEVQKSNNGGPGEGQVAGPSSSRWPKAEVEALINLRTRLDQKYQDNGPKGPLWEEISTAMRKLGYNRNAKRCKEKWENINKYFKKVKESNKKRPDDSKTCPYFHQLDALYREKTASSSTTTTNLGSVGPILAQPEQQWDPAHDDDDDDGDEEEEDDDDDQGSGGYEIVANNAAAAGGTGGGGGGGSMIATTTATTTAAE